MISQHPIEALHRSPIEWYTSIACGVAIGLLLGLPSVFFVSLPLKLTLIAGFGTLGAWRAGQGYTFVRYQRGLIRAGTVSSIASRHIRVSQQQLFLGRGFRWQPLHTQRLRDLAPLLRTPHKTQAADSTAAQTSDGNLALHAVGLAERDIHLDLAARAGHLWVVGTTGVGKTRFAEILLSQDIRRGDVVIIIDPKGDIELLRRITFEAQNAGREHDLLMFHLGFASVSARYNPIGQFTRSTEVANRVANQLPSAGESAAFKEFAWKFTNVITQVLVAMGIKPSYQRLKTYLHQLDRLLIDYLTILVGANRLDQWLQTEHDSLENEGKKDPSATPTLTGNACIQYIQQHKLHHTHPLLVELITAQNYEKSYFDKISASLSVLLDKMTTGEVAELISPAYDAPDDPRPIIDWMRVIRQRQIVYVGLDALSDATVASSVGNAMLSDLVSIAGQLYQHGMQLGLPEQHTSVQSPIIQLHVDEANEVIGNEFIPLLNKARGAGFRVTAYTQTLADIEARLQNKAKAEQVIGNLGTMILFRVRQAHTAQQFIDQLPTVNVRTLNPASSVTDQAHLESPNAFTSQNEDRIIAHDHPMLTVSDVLQLPKGQAFALLPGGALYKLRIPLPQAESSTLPDTPNALMQHIQITPRTLRTSLTLTQVQQRVREHTTLPPELFDVLYPPVFTHLWGEPSSLDAANVFNLLTRRQGILLPLGAGSETIAKQDPVWTYAVLIAETLIQTSPSDLSTFMSTLPQSAVHWLQQHPHVWQELTTVFDKNIKATTHLNRVYAPTASSSNTQNPVAMAFLNWVRRKLKQWNLSPTRNQPSYFLTSNPSTGKKQLWINTAGIDHYCCVKQLTRDHLWQALCEANVVTPELCDAKGLPASDTLWPLQGIGHESLSPDLPTLQEHPS